jgi:PPM family protein phosphatase
MPEFVWYGATDVGRARTENQDAVLPDGSGDGTPAIVAVADGLGGHPGGDVASRCAIDALVNADPGLGATDLVRIAHEAIFRRIVAEMDTRRELIQMATTLTLAILGSDDIAEIGHVGDSRAYHHDGESLIQVTEDHTHGMDRVATGELTVEEAKASPDWHVLSNYLGFESFRVATHRVTMRLGDRLLLCTDGLSNMLTDHEIAVLVAAGSPADSAQSLISAANEAGGLDNISVVVVEVIG